MPSPSARWNCREPPSRLPCSLERPPADRLLTAPYILLCVAVCIAALAPNLFIVAPLFLRAAGQDEWHIGMVMGSFPLASLLAMPLSAWVAERRGARFVLISGSVLVALGCAMFEAATVVPAWMLARSLQGLGWSGVLVGASLATTLLAPPARLTEAFGVSGVLTLLAMAMGPILGELLVRRAGWPWMFRLAAAVVVVGALLAVKLPSLRGRGASSELMVAPGALRPGGAEIRPLAAMFLVATGFGAVISFLADHSRLVGEFDVSPFFNAYVAMAILVRLTLGGLPDRVGAHAVLMPSFLGQALSLAALSFLRAKWQLWPAGALFGVTHGLYYPALTALMVRRAPEARRARAVASVHFVFALGMVVASFAGGALAERLGYEAVYLATAGLTAIGIAIIAIDRGSRPSGTV